MIVLHLGKNVALPELLLAEESNPSVDAAKSNNDDDDDDDAAVAAANEAEEDANGIADSGSMTACDSEVGTSTPYPSRIMRLMAHASANERFCLHFKCKQQQQL